MADVPRRTVALSALALGLTACSAPAVTEQNAGGSRPVPASLPSPTGASTTTSPAPAPSSASAVPTEAPPATGRFTAAESPASALVVVNKRRALAPVDFVPELIRPNVALATSGEGALLNPTTAQAAEAMFAAAASAGSPMTLVSGYRSYGAQSATYNGWVAREGQAMADVASARPGYSEHQTGWAFDIGDPSGACALQPCFEDTPAAQWAAAHAWEFGFIVRYPWMFHETTGYYYEPWHLRYIGMEAAAAMHAARAKTLEEFLGLPPAPTY